MALSALIVQLFLWCEVSICYAYSSFDGRMVDPVLTNNLLSYELKQNNERKIVGVITDENGESIIGASVQIKGTSVGVISDLNGRYSITISSKASVLVVSYIGYQTKEIVIDNRKIINIQLKENIQKLDEVTVVGYGVQKKATLTGAISSVGADVLLKSPCASITNSLAGQLPGVSTLQISGQPGADNAKIYVRGIGALSENAGLPLILVDGVERDFSQLDANEIESINVLKDASATAVFGVRGANGVILVTTRRGVEGKARISVNSSVGIQTPTRMLKTADSYTFAMAYNEAQANDGIPVDQQTFSKYALERFRLGDEPLIYPSVNWYDYLMNKIAVQTQHNVNVSGGTKDIRYFVSLGFLYQDGLFKQLDGLSYNNNYSYTRFNYRTNLDINLTRSTVIKIGIGGIVGNQHALVADVWHLLNYGMPFCSPGVVDGKKVVTDASRFNGLNMSTGSFFDAFYGKGYRRHMSNTMNFDLNLEQKLDFITSGLSINIKGSYNTNYGYSHKTEGHVEKWIPYNKSEVDGLGLKPGDQGFDKTVVYRIADQNLMDTRGEESNMRSKGRNWYLESGIRYNRKFGNHNIGALVLYNQSKKYYPGQYSDIPTAYVGLVGRLTYDYKTKYMAEFNIGYNGSENFAPDKRFGTFPAASIGYVLTEEDFFPKNDWLTYLKLRASVGLVGNDNMSNNRFLYLPDSYQINSSDKIGGYEDYNGYIFGLTNTAYEKAAREIRLGNPNVTWETALKQNYAIDAYFLKDRLKLTVDYFREKRCDILIQRQTIPSLISINSILPVVNMGTVKNHGYEIDLKWSDKINDFSYYVSTNVSYAKNKIIFMDEVEPNEPYMRRTGHEVGAQFGYVTERWYSDDDFNPDGSVKVSLPQPEGVVYRGDPKFADLNGDNLINSDDQTKIANPKRPAYTFGLNYGIDYKGFFASMNWTGAAQCDVQFGNGYIFPFTDGTLFQFQADGHWTPERGQNAKFPRLTLSNPRRSLASHWYRDASYVKLKNVTIGYNVTSQKFLKAIGATKMSVHLTGYNLLTLDKLKIADPEVELTRDGNEYPIMKIFNLGVNVTF